MFVVVSYDITDDRRRRKLFKLLEGYGQHQQYSVFECDISEKRYRELIVQIGKIINESEDSVRLYRLCGACQKEIEICGQGIPFEERICVVI